MKPVCRILLVMFLCGKVVGICATTISYDINFSADSLIVQRSDEYDVVNIKDAYGSNEPGDPDLPRILKCALIPHDAYVESVEVTDLQESELPGTYSIKPAQVPKSLSGPELTKKTAPNARIYSLKSIYPPEITEVTTTGNLNGFRIAGVTISPLRYLPSEKKLRLLTSGTLKLHLKSSSSAQPVISRRQYDETVPVLKKLALNSQDIMKYAPCVRSDAQTDVHYAIITDDTFKDSFDAFKFWKTRKGLITEVFTTSWIYSKYQGFDNPEKIRNFLKEYHAQKGLIYVLLAGDYDKVPQRLVPTTLNPGDIASDLYYADLDGTWDTNNDNKYGEPRRDSVDGYCDIFPGRLPVDNVKQIGFFIHKDTIMEKQPPLASLKKVLLPSTKLWSDKHGKIISNIIADSTNTGWMDIKLENPSRSAVRDSMNNGIYISHISSHGNPSGFLSDDSVYLLNKEDVQSMTAVNNTFPILYSIACNAGQFDNPSLDCIAEELVLRENGGCVATMLNSRFGYGAASANHLSGSEVLSLQITKYLFNSDTFNLGKVVAMAKHFLREDAWKKMPEMAKHNVVNGLTLLGDPDLPIFQNVPSALAADYEKGIKTGLQDFTVTVKSGGPVSAALVCCYKPGELHKTGYTDGSGKVNLSINPITNGKLYITVTAKDRLPFEGVSAVGTTAIDNNISAVCGAPGILSSISEQSGNVSIRYRTVQPSRVSAIVYDSRGAIVKKVGSVVSDPGVHTLSVNGCSAGIFFVKMSINENHSMKTAIIVK